MKHTIRRTWVPNKEGAIYTVTLHDGAQVKIIETAGAPIAIDGLYCFDDSLLDKISGVDFIDSDTFCDALAEIAEAEDRLTERVRLHDIADETIRDFIEAVIASD